MQPRRLAWIAGAVGAVALAALAAQMRHAARPHAPGFPPNASSSRVDGATPISTDPQAAPSSQEGFCRMLANPPSGTTPDDPGVVCECGRQYFAYVTKIAETIAVRADQRMERLEPQRPSGSEFSHFAIPYSYSYNPHFGRSMVDAMREKWPIAARSNCETWDDYKRSKGRKTSWFNEPSAPSPGQIASQARDSVYRDVENATHDLWLVMDYDFMTRLSEIQWSSMWAEAANSTTLATKVQASNNRYSIPRQEAMCASYAAGFNQAALAAIAQAQAIVPDMHAARDQVAAYVRRWAVATKRDSWPQPLKIRDVDRTPDSMDMFGAEFFQLPSGHLPNSHLENEGDNGIAGPNLDLSFTEYQVMDKKLATWLDYRLCQFTPPRLSPPAGVTLTSSDRESFQFRIDPFTTTTPTPGTQKVEPVDILFVQVQPPFRKLDTVEFEEGFRVELRYAGDPGSNTVPVHLQTTSGGVLDVTATRVSGDPLRYRTDPIDVGDKAH